MGLRSIALPASVALVAVALTGMGVGCSSSSGTNDRTSQGNDGDGGVDTGSNVPPDPNDGRDDTAASCYAACSNVAFTCKTKGSTVTPSVEMAGDMNGCAGILTSGSDMLPIQLDCNMRKICVATAPGGMPTSCTSGKYSGTSFAYTPTGGAGELVCTRSAM